MALHRLSFGLALVVLAAAAFTLAACGRNGPPLPPPGPVAGEPPPGTVAGPPPPMAPSSTIGGPVASGAAAQAAAQKNGFDTFGNPVAPPGQKKSFLLDPLLQ